jgi:hypothetical protein
VDPFTRLTLFLWQFSRRRHSRKELIVYMAVLVVCLAIGFAEWAGYWPDGLTVKREGIPKVDRL